MVVHAEILRLESQLTIPSRHHPHLRDFWISVSWTSDNARWASAFADIATLVGAAPTAFGAFSVEPFSLNKGWIIARGVDGKLVRPEDLEAKVRELAAEVNARLSEAPMLGDRSVTVDGWPEVVRVRLAKANALVSGLGLASPRRDVDVPSRA